MKDLRLSLIITALDRATAPLKKVGAALGQVHQHVEKLGHAMHKLGMAEFIGGAFFTGVALEATHAVVELTDHVAEMGATALKSAEQTGASAEAMQRWFWAAKQVDVSADTVTRGFAMMNVHIGRAVKGMKDSVDAFKLMHISMKEVRALSKDPDAMFARIIQGYQSLKNPAQQAVAAQGIFSRSWFEMAPLLKTPQAELGRLMDQLRKSHMIMSTEEAEAAKKYLQAKNEMGAAVQGLGVRIGDALIPKLTDVTEKVTKWIESLKSEDIQKFTDAVGKLADEIPKLLPKIQGIIDGLVNFTDAVLRATDNTGFLKFAIGALTVVMATQAIVAIVSTTASIVGVGAAAVTAAGLIWTLIPAVTGLTDVMALLSLAMDANPIGVIALAIGALIAAIALLVIGLVELHNHWDDVVRFMEDGCKKIEKAFTDLESHMPKWLQNLINGGLLQLAIANPALGGLAAGVDAIAHAPPPKAKPAGVDKLSAAIDASKAASAKAGQAAPGAPGGLSIPAIIAATKAAQAASGSSSQVLGTIIIKAAPGTAVAEVKKAAGIDFQWDRGPLFA